MAKAVYSLSHPFSHATHVSGQRDERDLVASRAESSWIKEDIIVIIRMCMLPFRNCTPRRQTFVFNPDQRLGRRCSGYLETFEHKQCIEHQAEDPPRA